MARAFDNPLGLLPPSGSEVVRVGEMGVHTHVLNPKTGFILCRSNIQNAPTLYKSSAKRVTCARCVKLLRINQAKGVS